VALFAAVLQFGANAAQDGALCVYESLEVEGISHPGEVYHLGFGAVVDARYNLLIMGKRITLRCALNELLRAVSLRREGRASDGTLTVRPIPMGYRADLRHDDIESLIEYGEGDRHR
jgi:hypothetical protein